DTSPTPPLVNLSDLLSSPALPSSSSSSDGGGPPVVPQKPRSATSLVSPATSPKVAPRPGFGNHVSAADLSAAPHAPVKPPPKPVRVAPALPPPKKKAMSQAEAAATVQRFARGAKARRSFKMYVHYRSVVREI